MSVKPEPETPKPSPSDAPKTHFQCLLCTETWPVHLMVQHGEHHLCCPCNGKLKDDSFRRTHAEKLRRYGIGQPAVNPSAKRIKVILASVLGVVLLGGFLVVQLAKRMPIPGLGFLLNRDVGHIFMESSATLPGGKKVAGQAFFLQGPARTVAVTTAVSRMDGATDKQADISYFEKWTFTLPDKPGYVLPAHKIQKGHYLQDRKNIWLLEFALSPTEKLATNPLPPQKTAIEAGAPLRLLRPVVTGGKISEAISPAKVESAFANGVWLTVHFAERIPAAGLLGAPLINPMGELVGVVDRVTEKPDAQGKIATAEAIGALELLGMPQPKPPDAKKSK